MIGASPVSGRSLAALFRPSFLRAFVEKRHGGILRQMGMSAIASSFSSLRDLYDAAYAAMEREYRCEYVFKNALIHEGPARDLVTPHFAVYSEWPIAYWVGRADILVFSETSTSYEIKSDIDDLDRLSAQIALNLRLFDQNYVVCAPPVLKDVRTVVGSSRVGIVVSEPQGHTVVRKARSNARNVDTDAIFGTLREGEAENILRSNGIEVAYEPAQRFEALRTAFGRLRPLKAHDGFVQAFRSRPKAATMAQLFKDVPRPLKHLFFKSKEAERYRLLGEHVLARRVG